MRNLSIAVTCALLLCAKTAHAKAPAGVWTGTLGPSAVAACFDSESASYYYVKFGIDIPLSEREPGIWDEKKADDSITGTWQLSGPKGDTLAGVWKSPDGKRSLPVALKRVPAKDKLECPSPEYNAPRIAAVVRTPGKEKVVGGLAIRAFRALKGAIKGVEIIGDTDDLAPTKSALEGIHRQLLDGYFNCMASQTQSDMSPEFSGEVAIDTVTNHFLVVRRSSGFYCGGAHPDGSLDVVTLGRATGETIDIKAWLKASPDAIGRKLWKPSSKECADALLGDTSFSAWPSGKGLVLRPILPHAIAACETEKTIPYARLASQLTPAGKQATDEFAGATP